MQIFISVMGIYLELARSARDEGPTAQHAGQGVLYGALAARGQRLRRPMVLHLGPPEGLPRSFPTPNLAPVSTPGCP